MATSTRLKMEELLDLLDDIEIEIFGVVESKDKRNSDIGIFHDKTYTRGDFNRFKVAVKQVKKVYEGGTRKSWKYINNNKEYDNLIKRVMYWTKKENKTQKDYQKLEYYTRKLEEYKRLRAEKRKEETMERNKEVIKEVNEIVKMTEGDIYDVQF